MIRDQAWESRQLPEHPFAFTCRGRHIHVDQWLAQRLEFKGHAGATIRVLDLGCGVLPFGSPTLHDLYDMFSEHGVRPEVTGVDVSIPDDLDPTYPDIAYERYLAEVEGPFDVVRVLHLWPYLSLEQYLEMRDEALARLRMGGLFIATQQLKRQVPNKGYWSWLEPTTKVAQRTQDGIVSMELLPDRHFAHWVRQDYPVIDEGRAEEYLRHRNAIANGDEPLVLELNDVTRYGSRLSEYGQVLGYLLELKTNVLQFEWLSDQPESICWWNFADPYTLHKQSDYFGDSSHIAERFWESHSRG